MTSIKGVPDDIVQEAELRFREGVKFHNGSIISSNSEAIKTSTGELRSSLTFSGALSVIVKERGSLFTIWHKGIWAIPIEELEKEVLYEIY